MESAVDYVARKVLEAVQVRLGARVVLEPLDVAGLRDDVRAAVEEAFPPPVPAAEPAVVVAPALPTGPASPVVPEG